MEITQENVDKLNAVLKVQLNSNDYSSKVEARLNELRKQARIPGFRPGKVPMGVIRKMAGTSTLVEEVNKILSESINSYIVENKISILGNPIPKIENNEVDWEKQEDFEFNFELGLTPEVNVEFLPKLKFNRNSVEIDSKLINQYTDDMSRRYGKLIEVETSEESDVLEGAFEQLGSDRLPLEDGIQNNSSLLLESVTEKKLKKRFLGIQKGSVVEFKLKEFGADVDFQRLLGTQISEEDRKNMNFRFVVDKINRIEAAEVSTELFDKIYGPGVIKSKEEFENKAIEDLTKQFEVQTDQLFARDVQDKIIEKAKLDLPDEFLKKWLQSVNEKPITPEQIEAEYDMYAKNLKWQLLENTIITENKMEVSREEVIDFTVELIKQQFASMGQGAPEDMELKETAERVLQNKEEEKRVYDQMYDQRLLAYYKNTFKIKEKKISYNDFVKLASSK